MALISRMHRSRIVPNVPIGAAALLAAALALASCRAPQATGDAKGGIVDWFAASKGQVEDAAAGHCARYGKKARVGKPEASKAGGEAVFACE